jgi:hypothetical protein
LYARDVEVLLVGLCIKSIQCLFRDLEIVGPGKTSVDTDVDFSPGAAAHERAGTA